MTQAIFKLQNSSFRLNLIFFKTYIWLAIFVSLIYHPVSAQSVVSIDRDITNKPIILTGSTGGDLKTVEVSQTEKTATGYCGGYVTTQPNHLLELESFFDLLRLELESAADTTVLIKGDNGIWCNDDSGSANPMIEGQWQQGSYKVWVGSYQPNANDNYQIKITAQ